jgi:uncharacterized protein YjbI with pentapeptide repeats
MAGRTISEPTMVFECCARAGRVIGLHAMRKPAGEAVLARALAWARCGAEAGRCRGVRLDHADHCLAHADSPERASAYQRLADGAPLDFARGVTFTSELLDELLDHAPTDEHHRTLLRKADFTNAAFSDASFYSVAFQSPVRFNGATFEGEADFRRTSYDGDVGFRRATFSGDARFSEAVFGEGQAGFGEATFKGVAEFVEIAFEGDAFFTEVVFERDAAFVLASSGDVTFGRARFMGSTEFGPITVEGAIDFDDVAFSQSVRLVVAAGRLSCQRTRFLAGGYVRVARAAITLADAEVSAPLIVAGQTPSVPFIERAAWRADDPDAGTPIPRALPTLISVERADVGGLVVADLDLCDCHFVGAHHLDQLQLPSARAFHRAPGWWGSGRQVLAEECAWRHQRGRRRGRSWQSAATIASAERFSFPEDVREPEPGELAGIYRQLRKGREAAKNELGAADFYYGECEMRRHASETPPVEKILLTLYWLVSGYGLRAWRALGCLAILVVAAAVGLHQIGFAMPLAPSLPTVLVFAAESVVSLDQAGRTREGVATVAAGAGPGAAGSSSIGGPQPGQAVTTPQGRSMGHVKAPRMRSRIARMPDQSWVAISPGSIRAASTFAR